MSSKFLPGGEPYRSDEITGIDNAAILAAYQRFKDHPDTRKTHLFNDRYENVYIPREKVPALEPVFAELEKRVLAMTGCDPDRIKLGFWMNAMEPRQTTTLHSHDDWDEVVSAVYYVSVPPRSGHLVLVDGAERHALSPRTGRYIMFSPAMPHSVTVNHSDAMRLSVGINIGIEGAEIAI